MSSPMLTLNLGETVPLLAPTEDGRYRLQSQMGELAVELLLSEAQVRTLALSALHHLPDIESRYAVVEEEDVFRLPARKLALLDDRSIQVLLRELQSDDLIDFLWYMDDAEFAKRFFHNLSQRAAEMLLDDLKMTFGFRKPDDAPLAYVSRAREACQRVLAMYDQLAGDGQITAL